MALARGDIADGLQPGAAQAADDGVIRAEREQRQRPDRLGFLADSDDAAMGMVADGARADRSAGDARR